MKVIANLMKGYGFKAMQEFCNMHQLLKSNGKTAEDLVAFVERRKQAMADREVLRSKVMQVPCRGCGRAMTFAPVNVSRATQTGDSSTFVWTCPRCDEQYWTSAPLRTIVSAINKARKSSNPFEFLEKRR